MGKRTYWTAIGTLFIIAIVAMLLKISYGQEVVMGCVVAIAATLNQIKE